MKPLKLNKMIKLVLAVHVVVVALASMTASGFQIYKPTTTCSSINININSTSQPKQKQTQKHTQTQDSRCIPTRRRSFQFQSRKQFNNLLKSTFCLSPLALLFTKTAADPSNAFEGGVGGLGKTKPNTGVQFANPDLIPDVATKLSTTSIPGDYNAELLAPDGTPVFLSFYAAWPMLKSQGIESRDLANAEAAFVQVAPKPDNYSGTLQKKFFIDTIFGPTGKFGAYGEATDVKVSKVPGGVDSESTSTSTSNNSKQRVGDLYVVSFTTLTPAMRESDRKAYVSTKIVGDGVFMLVTGTTMGRFRSKEGLLRRVAESFDCLEAPRSSLRR